MEIFLFITVVLVLVLSLIGVLAAAGPVVAKFMHLARAMRRIYQQEKPTSCANVVVTDNIRATYRQMARSYG